MEWRNIGHAKWYDPYAKYENTKGKDFQHALHNEERRLEALPKPHRIQWKKDIQTFFEASLPNNPDYGHESIVWNDYTIQIQYVFGYKQNVWFLHTKTGKYVQTYTNLTNFIFDPESSFYATMEDVGNGSECLQLNVYDAFVFKWSKKPVGPTATFHNGHIYYQTVENALRYPSIVHVDKNNTSSKIVYNNPDKRFQVEIIQKDAVFFKTYNALDQKIGILHGNTYTWIASAHETLIPIAKDCYLTNTAFVYKNTPYALPHNQYGMDGCVGSRGIYILTIHCGIHTMYRFDPSTHTFHTHFRSKTPNEIRFMHHSPRFLFGTPNKSSKLYDLETNRVLFSYPEPLTIPYYVHGFADGVPYTFVSVVKHPKKLCVQGYGAYGIHAQRSYPIRWLAWLKRGYALVVCSPRGGRDDGDAWYDGGRTALRKHHTFEDTARVIEAVQKRFCISPKHTIMYGRSAGGWLASIIGQQYPHLVGAIYAEVPYVDILRTTTNPTLPLTQLEYDEFGNPTDRPEEYNALRKISPFDTIQLAPLDAPLFLVKTAIHDMQVLPYEALKYTLKLRDHGWNVYLSVDREGGHFVSEKSMYDQFAEDVAILDAHISAVATVAGVGKTRRGKRRSHCSMGTRRRRTSSLKHRTKH